MTLIESRPLMTTRELLAMPDDGIERELSQGILKEREIRRGRRHARAGSAIAKLLGYWLDSQSKTAW